MAKINLRCILWAKIHNSTNVLPLLLCASVFRHYLKFPGRHAMFNQNKLWIVARDFGLPTKMPKFLLSLYLKSESLYNPIQNIVTNRNPLPKIE